MYIRKTTERDLKVFRPAYHDILEAEAMGIEPSFPDVSECVTLVWDGECPLAIGGNHGDQCWFVTSDRVVNLTLSQRREFIELIKEYRDEMLSKYDTLWNFVWVGNHPHIKFLKSIGAVFHNEYTKDGKFQLFTIRRT